MTPDENDMQVWEIISTFPEMSMMLKVIVLVLNLIVAGTGTIVMAIFGARPISKVQLLIGLLQLLTIWSLIGFFWALVWSILMFWKTRRPTQGLASAGAEGKPDMGRVGGVASNPFENRGGMA